MIGRCRNTPLPVARQLRKEANFGCCRCGHPLLDNAHIIPYHVTHDFRPEDMLVLCPRCHRIIDDGGFPEEALRRLKANPYNKTHVGEEFSITNENLVVNLGGAKMVDTPKVLVFNDTIELVSVKKGVIGDVLLDANFYDKEDQLVAQVTENFWTVNTQGIWDLIYKPKELVILNAP